MIRFSLLVLFILSCSLPAESAEPGERILRDLPYISGGDPVQSLDLYMPAGGNELRPLVVWIHGGGWEGGDKRGCPARPLTSRGFAAASVGYRLSRQAIYPAQIEDCKAAIRWLRSHAAEYSIDPKRIGVWGSSAGGHLVALLGTTGSTRDFDVGENLDQSSAVQCVVDWFGPTDFLHWGEPGAPPVGTKPSSVSRLLGGLVSERQEIARRASPISFVSHESAPFLIMHGSKDPLVPPQQSVELNDALKKAGVESALKILPGAGHGGSAFSSPDNLKEIEDFFDAHLHPSAAAKP